MSGLSNSKHVEHKFAIFENVAVYEPIPNVRAVRQRIQAYGVRISLDFIFRVFTISRKPSFWDLTELAFNTSGSKQIYIFLLTRSPGVYNMCAQQH